MTNATIQQNPGYDFGWQYNFIENARLLFGTRALSSLDIIIRNHARSGATSVTPLVNRKP